MIQHNVKNQEVDIDSRKKGVCKKCGAPIFWAKTYVQNRKKWVFLPYDDYAVFKLHECNNQKPVKKNTEAGKYFPHLFAAKTGNRGEIRVFQKVQNMAMHAGSRTQSIPKFLSEKGLVDWVKVGKRHFLRITWKAFDWNPDFWKTKMTLEDSIELEKIEKYEEAREKGIASIDSFL